MFKYDLLDLNKETEIIKIGEKTIYNVDGYKSASDWVREEVKGLKTFDVPQMSSSLNVKQKGVGKVTENSMGYFFNKTNNVASNPINVAIVSSVYSDAHGLSVVPENIHKVTTLFCARKSIQPNWINQKDEYLAPNEEHEQFEQFKYDSLVYTLFNSASNQSSLRQVEYKEKLWDIKNEFFWLSVDRMKELADENGYDELYNDARTASDRHVYKLLFGEERIYDKLSDDAKAVLDKATELVEKSMTMRQVMADDQNHLNSWDAGYAQLKLVWKEYFEEDFKEFRKLYKEMEDRMRPLVYELGFLMK